MQFAARIITGAGRGKKIGTPTINMHLDDVPKELKEGIYACRVEWNAPLHVMVSGACPEPRRRVESTTCKGAAVLHYGPRPVFKDSPSCEVHILDEHIEYPPNVVTIEIVKYLRPVMDFPSPKALKEQIEKDIEEARNTFME